MSTQAEPIQHEVEVEDLLLQILKELRLLNMLMKEMTGFDITKDDLDE